jgi:cell division protein FtsB
MVEQAKKELEEIKAIPVAAVKVVKAIRNEIIDVIRAVAERNKNRLTLPIMKGEFIGKISDRTVLQDKSNMEAYVQRKGWTTFAEMEAERKIVKAQYDQLDTDKAFS